MNFFAVLFALLIEQARPLARDNWVYQAMRAWIRWVSRNFDTGNIAHAWLAWSTAVLVPAAVAMLVYWALLQFSVILAFVWVVAILYVTLGFRQFSHFFTAIREALEAGDEDRARQTLAIWQQIRAEDLPKPELIRQVIEYSVVAAHRHVIGVLCAFSLAAVLGLGPAGAIVYRLAEFVARYWEHKARVAGLAVSPALQTVALGNWRRMDYLPARSTAIGFAVVGNFEDAVDCWRRHASDAEDGNAVVVAATAGAINIRLGRMDGAGADGVIETGEAPTAQNAAQGLDGTPQNGHLAQVVGLVWRSVVLWLLMMALLSLARLIG